MILNKKKCNILSVHFLFMIFMNNLMNKVLKYMYFFLVIINHFVSLFWPISSFHHYSYLINGFRAAVFFFFFFFFSFFLLIFLFWLSFVYFFRPIGMKNDFKIAGNLGQNGTNKKQSGLGEWTLDSSNLYRRSSSNHFYFQ